jgi:hypothetical protein
MPTIRWARCDHMSSRVMRCHCLPQVRPLKQRALLPVQPGRWDPQQLMRPAQMTAGMPVPGCWGRLVLRMMQVAGAELGQQTLGPLLPQRSSQWQMHGGWQGWQRPEGRLGWSTDHSCASEQLCWLASAGRAG